LQNYRSTNEGFSTLTSEIVGGGKRDRTADLLHAMQALSQLSYTPDKSDSPPETSEQLKAVLHFLSLEL
jgi:hypothetical protein